VAVDDEKFNALAAISESERPLGSR
jgi:hypothetical protein